MRQYFEDEEIEAKLNARPKLRPRQLEILILLYRFRYLNRAQIQKMLLHKNHRSVIAWLKDLVNQGYIDCEYDKKLAALPSVYSLNIIGRNYLKDDPQIKIGAMKWIWRKEKLSSFFKEHCLFMADIYIELWARTNYDEYFAINFYTKVDMFQWHKVKPPADASYSMRDENNKLKEYFLEVFEDLPSIYIRRRISQYFAFHEDYYHPKRPFPAILFILPNNKLKGHAYYYVVKKHYGEEDLFFYITTKSLVKRYGMNTKTFQRLGPDDY
jgi:hypothetical protein